MAVNYENKEFYSLEKTIEVFKKLEYLNNSTLSNKEELIKEIKEDIVMSHVGIVKNVLKKMENASYDEDLFQVGIVALYDSIEKFDYKRNVCFNTFAQFVVKSSIVFYTRKNNSMVNIPYGFYSLRRIYKKYISKYRLTYGKKPSEEEIMEYLKSQPVFLKYNKRLDSGEMLVLFDVFYDDEEISLNQTISEDIDSSIQDNVISNLTDYNLVVNDIDDKMLIAKLKQKLEPFLYYTIYHTIIFPNMTLIEAAKRLSVSKQYLSSEIQRKKELISYILDSKYKVDNIDIDLTPLSAEEIIEMRKLRKANNKTKTKIKK